MEMNLPTEIEKLTKEYFEHQQAMLRTEGKIQYLQSLMTELQQQQTKEPANDTPVQMEQPIQ